MNDEIVILIALTIGTMLTRFLPFILFPTGKQTPNFINYLGEKLPYASMGLLVVYCLKGVSITTGSHGVPELIAIIITSLLQIWKKNVLISISIGTITYMFLIQILF